MTETKEYTAYLDELFWKAFKINAFGSICSLLRVGGNYNSNWDPFEESKKAFDDFNWLLELSKNGKNNFCSLRISLLIYCQALEMTAAHEIIANLIRCLGKSYYVYDPFDELINRKKNTNHIPPSAKAKFNLIKKLSKNCGETKLSDYINSFYNDKIRNAFSHSDYILTDTGFRYTEGGPAQEISLIAIEETLNNCFNFYSTFLSLHKIWLRKLAKLKKFHKWQNYEVLELLSNEEMGLYGFQIHFSNGSKSTYQRLPSGVDALNLFFEDDGRLNYYVGFLDNLEPIWKIEGVPIKDWSMIQ
jgi:hypothetical protein